MIRSILAVGTALVALAAATTPVAAADAAPAACRR
jgi:hypothetical protein